MKNLLGILLLTLVATASADVVVPSDEVESFVNIRSAPDGGADVISRLQHGIPRAHVGTSDGWHEVELDDGSTGFVSADWSRVIAGDAVEPESVEAVEEAPVAVEEPEAPAIAEEGDEALVAAGDTAVDDAMASTAVEQEATEPEAEPVAEPVVEEPAAEAGEAPAEAAPPPPAGEPVVGVPGPAGPPGPPGPPGEASIKGGENFLVRFKDQTTGVSSQVWDDGNFVGIGTKEPKQRLEVNGSIQIHEQNSSVAGIMITQSSGDTGYILHNRASTLTIGAGSVDRMTIDRNGNVGFGVPRPSHPIELANGAHVTAGGVWTNSSSRARKENIRDVTVEEALKALAALEPVHFNYRNDSEAYLGFIAEDVPDLVAMQDRSTLSSMDVVALLTRVIQEQQRRIDKLEAALAVERE